MVFACCFLQNSLLVLSFLDVDADSQAVCIVQRWCSVCFAVVGHLGIQCLELVIVYEILHVNAYWVALPLNSNTNV